MVRKLLIGLATILGGIAMFFLITQWLIPFFIPTMSIYFKVGLYILTALCCVVIPLIVLSKLGGHTSDESE